MSKDIFNNIAVSSLSVILLMAASCAADRDIDNEPAEDAGIVVIADMAKELLTRSYQESGTVMDGRYFMTYPNNSNGYSLANVDFGVTPSNPQIGVVTVPPASQLKWLGVGGGSTPTFYLDNVSNELGNSTTVPLPAVDNPYEAAPFDMTDGTNDLLWGLKQVGRNTGTIHFDLNHMMARVRVIITADNSNGEIDLNGATVTLTSINQKPVAFNRLDGSLELNPDISSYTDLVIVNEGDGWLNDITTDDAGNLTYQTQDFVLPPQELLEDDHRPRLKITLKNGDSYTGILPSAMLIYTDGDTNPEPSYPVALSFLSQYILTIRTVVTDVPPELVFMPVWVMQWVDKGDFTIEAHQAGIYTAQEFYNLIRYYEEENEFQLQRYGYKTDNGWVFQFFHSTTLDYNQIYGRMREKPDLPFEFNFTNFAQFVNTGTADNPELRQVTTSELWQIVNGQ